MDRLAREEQTRSVGDDAAGDQNEADDELFAEAIAQATSWGTTHQMITGMWTDRRHLSIGVGIIAGDEIETTEALRRLVPARISIRTRVASAALASLWQLQIDLHAYLEDAGIWGQWAVALGTDRSQQSIKVGLLPETPARVADQVRDAFPGRPVTFATSIRARAL